MPLLLAMPEKTALPCHYLPTRQTVLLRIVKIERDRVTVKRKRTKHVLYKKESWDFTCGRSKVRVKLERVAGDRAVLSFSARQYEHENIIFGDVIWPDQKGKWRWLPWPRNKKRNT